MATVIEQPACRLLPALELAGAVREGLTRTPKQLPPWLFYDHAGSLLFERITELPEYYLTRIERGLLAAHADEMIAAAAESHRLHLIELGAGSADKTRTLLAAALAHQGTVEYQPVDVSHTALETACRRIERELPMVTAIPVVADYTREWAADQKVGGQNERKLLLWIGSSIGNFDPAAAIELLQRINRTMRAGDGLLLGVDLTPCAGGKCIEELVAAYDDAAGVTSEFNSNILVRLNRELGANFDPEAFAHRAIWNPEASRMEMHLESLSVQSVRIDALDLTVEFDAGERLHTENSYKYEPGQADALMNETGFPVIRTWADAKGWFAVLLGMKI
jgi:dimethylhistidine N-methyltransferase